MGPELRNLTPFANMQFSNWDSKGREFGVLMVKTSWDIQPDGTCKLSDEQEPFVFTDEFHGELNKTAVRYASDLVPYKPKTDILLNATTYAPENVATTTWESAIVVRSDEGEIPLIERKLQITGSRQWYKTWRGWRLSEPEPITQCDLRYDLAFGGSVQKGTDADGKPLTVTYEKNPVGRGYADAKRLEDSTPIDAPQILATGQDLTKPTEELSPVGVGPIPAAWLPRRPRGGTYDSYWQDNVWPLWPQDYSFGFHNAASEGMAINLPPDSGVQVVLKQMHPEKTMWTIDIPHPRLAAYMAIDGKVIPSGLMTDTIHLDISDDCRSDPRAYQISRLVFDRTRVDNIVLARLAENEDLGALSIPPHPHDVAQFIPDDMSEIPA